MPRRAGRRERAGDGEQSHALAGEKFAAGGRLRPVGGRDRKRNVGQAVAHLDGHSNLSFASVEAADRTRRTAASSLARRAVCGPLSRSWLSNRVSCRASCFSQCPEWPIRGSNARLSRCASMTRMVRSAIGVGRKRAGITFRGLLRQLDIEPGEAPDCAVHHGGPVEPGRGFVLHSTDWGGQDTLHVNGDDGETVRDDRHDRRASRHCRRTRAVAVDRGARLCRLGRGAARRGDDPPWLVRRAGRCQDPVRYADGRALGGVIQGRRASTRVCWRARPAPPDFNI